MSGIALLEICLEPNPQPSPTLILTPTPDPDLQGVDEVNQLGPPFLRRDKLLSQEPFDASLEPLLPLPTLDRVHSILGQGSEGRASVTMWVRLGVGDRSL